MSNKKVYSAVIEAMLYYENNVVTIEKIKKVTGLSYEEVMAEIDVLIAEYNRPIHGMTIVESAGGFSFRPKKEIIEDIRDYYSVKAKDRLPKSALTVLSIIAYKQPVTKSEIEEIRGVSSDNQIRQLMEKNFIKIVGKKEDAFRKPLLYGTTKEFLNYFNLMSINDLPQVDELKQTEFDPDE